MSLSSQQIEGFMKKYKGNGRQIIQFPERNPTTLYCVLYTAQDNTLSIMIVLTQGVKPHFHVGSTENYQLLSGELILKKNESGVPHTHHMRLGEFAIVGPGVVHSTCAINSPAELLVVSKPAWCIDNHHVQDSE